MEKRNHEGEELIPEVEPRRNMPEEKEMDLCQTAI